MYDLVIEPAKAPVSYNEAMRELYEHAHRRQLSVHPLEGGSNTSRSFELRSRYGHHVVQRATIARSDA
jgi:hypothetical protein